MEYASDVERMKSCSCEHEQDFFTQENSCLQLEFLVKNTKCLTENISRDGVLQGCGLFTNLVYAVVLRDKYFLTYDDKDGKNTLLAFISPGAAKEFCKKYGDELIFVRFDDLHILVKAITLDCIEIAFASGGLNIKDDFIRRVISTDFIYNCNETSRYEISEAVGYDKEKEEYLSTFKKYDFLKKLWLVHIKEYKDVNEYAENGNYSPEYDVIVAEMPLDYYIDMREYLQSIVYKSKGKVLKVVLSESDLGRKFISEVAPFYIND